VIDCAAFWRGGREGCKFLPTWCWTRSNSVERRQIIKELLTVLDQGPRLASLSKGLLDNECRGITNSCRAPTYQKITLDLISSSTMRSATLPGIVKSPWPLKRQRTSPVRTIMARSATFGNHSASKSTVRGEIHSGSSHTLGPQAIASKTISVPASATVETVEWRTIA
jgi:hypothetical protein